jgi:exopolysaccharide biosynthesis protein
MSTSAAVVPSPGAAAARGEDPLSRPLDIGSAGLAEQRTVSRLAPGVTLYEIVRGQVDPDDHYTATAGFATTAEQAESLEAKVREAGLEPRRDPSVEPSPLGGPLGWAVRAGRYAEQAEAEAAVTRLKAVGLNARVDDSAHDGGETTGPWRVTMVAVDPQRFDGAMRSELATEEVFGRETTSAMADRYDAIAAVNGGFFTIDGTRDTPGPWLEGTDGDLGGVGVRDGDVLSEGVGDRPALVLREDDGEADVRRVTTELWLSPVGGTRHEVTGLNRTPGLVTNCGGVGDVYPVDAPAHDYTCGNDHELVVLGSEFGAPLPAGDGFQVSLDGEGRVTEAAQGRGGPEPQGDAKVIQATGDEARWLEEHAEVGDRLRLGERVVDADTGEEVPLGSETSMVNGGPLLVDGSRPVLDPVRDGWSPEAIDGNPRAEFFWRWYVRRNPRTAAGVLPDGRVVFVQVDGRQPGRSVGLGITETARLLDGLGAVEAINLDGGGSSAVATDGRGLVNTPSDPVERPVADALVLTAR